MTILHLEDEQSVADTFQQACGQTVTHVTTVAAAHQALKHERFDLLAVDLNVEDSFGVDTVVELAVYHLPMIVITDAMPNTIRAAATKGATDFIRKRDLKVIDLPLRLQFVSDKHHRKERARFAGLDALKPFLSCAKTWEAIVPFGGVAA